jgi:hypothetical protein
VNGLCSQTWNAWKVWETTEDNKTNVPTRINVRLVQSQFRLRKSDVCVFNPSRQSENLIALTACRTMKSYS